MSAGRIPLPTPELVAAVANCFIENVLYQIGPDALEKVRGRNRLGQYEGCCASHDFCDSNMSMCAAMGKIVGVGEMPDEASDPQFVTWVRFVNAAWDLARACEFRAPFQLEWEVHGLAPVLEDIPVAQTCRERHTLTFFAEGEAWDAQDLFGINALDLGESYVKTNSPNGVAYIITRLE